MGMKANKIDFKTPCPLPHHKIGYAIKYTAKQTDKKQMHKTKNLSL
jgi:hypothetical protein